MRKNMRLTSIMAIVTVMALLIGSLAFFTDRVAANASVTTMSTAVDIVPIEPENTPDDPNDDKVITNLSTFWAEGNANAVANYNPGDVFDLSYSLKNNGSMDVITRETIVITSDKAMSDAPEFALCASTSNSVHGGQVAGTLLRTDKVSTTQYKYVLESDEVLGAGKSIAKSYYVVFNELADNSWQGVKCTVNYLVEALQSDGSWDTIAEATLSNGTWSGGVEAAS